MLGLATHTAKPRLGQAALLHMQVGLLLQCEIKAPALTLATHHVQLAPTALEPWLQLARAYALQGSEP